MAENNKVNVSADHTEPAFFTDALTVSHTPEKFVLDFTQTTPRFDQVSGERHQSFTIKHRAILADPVFAKVILEVLQDNVEKYEEQHGEIEVPERKTTPVPEPSEEDAARSTSYIG